MIELGSKCRDKLTGFAGIAVARTQWLYGCERYTIQPEKLDKDGKVLDTVTFDEPQLEVVGAPSAKAQRKAASEPGGPRPAPSRSPDPKR